MGEVADMLMDGTLCECCGVLLAGEPQGYPGRCPGCEHRETPYVSLVLKAPKVRDNVRVSLPPDTTFNCPTCQRLVRAVGYKDHCKDAHQS